MVVILCFFYYLFLGVLFIVFYGSEIRLNSGYEYTGFILLGYGFLILGFMYSICGGILGFREVILYVFFIYVF